MFVEGFVRPDLVKPGPWGPGTGGPASPLSIESRLPQAHHPPRLKRMNWSPSLIVGYRCGARSGARVGRHGRCMCREAIFMKGGAHAYGGCRLG